MLSLFDDLLASIYTFTTREKDSLQIIQKIHVRHNAKLQLLNDTNEPKTATYKFCGITKS